MLKVGHLRALQVSAEKEKNLEMLRFIWKLYLEDLSKRMWKFQRRNQEQRKTADFFPFVSRDWEQQEAAHCTGGSKPWGWGTGQGLTLELSFFLYWFYLSSFPIFSWGRHWPPAVLPPVSSVHPRALWMDSLYLGDFLVEWVKESFAPRLVASFSSIGCSWVSSKAFSDSTTVCLKCRTSEKKYCAVISVAAASCHVIKLMATGERGCPSLCPRKSCT